MRVLLVAVLWAGCALGQWPGPPGQVNLQLGGPAIQIRSSGYPSNSLNPVESVTVVAPAGAVVNLYCFDIRVVSFIRPHPPCTDFVMMLVDGTTPVEAICDQRTGHSFISRTNRLTVELRSGAQGVGAFMCEVSAKAPGGGMPGGGGPPGSGGPSWGGNSRSPYFSKESMEVDSSEHGGRPGIKKTTCDCGFTNKGMQRIVGGSNAAANEYPFAAAIVDHTKRQFCGGTIISKRHVITAAHCTDPVLQAGGSISVILGAHSVHAPESTSQLIPVERILQHAQYNGQVFKNDISLLLLQRDIQFSKYVAPACLSSHQNNLEKQYVKIIGWGMVRHNGASSPILKKVNIRVVPLSHCGRVYPESVSQYERKQICTHSANQQGACMGDSGGPVIWVDPETNRYTLVGLVSFGRVCAAQEPTVHTDVSAYFNWIVTQMKQSAPGQTHCSKAG